MVEAKLAEHDMPLPPLQTVKPGEIVELGSMTAEFMALIPVSFE
jgi:hypothetical protein